MEKSSAMTQTQLLGVQIVLFVNVVYSTPSFSEFSSFHPVGMSFTLMFYSIHFFCKPAFVNLRSIQEAVHKSPLRFALLSRSVRLDRRFPSFY